MAEFSLFTETPQLAANADSAVTVGCEFRVDTACWLVGFRYLHATGGNSDHRVAGLFDAADSSLVAGPLTMPVGAGGQWCDAYLSESVALPPGNYRVGILHPNGDYPFQGNYFDTIDDTVRGPITVLSYFSIPGNTQGSFSYGASLTYPTSGAGSAGNFWSDVIVSDVDPGGGGGESHDGFVALGAVGTLTASGVGTMPQHEIGAVDLSAGGALTFQVAVSLRGGASSSADGVLTARAVASVSSAASSSADGSLALFTAPAMASEALFESVGVLSVEGIPSELNSATVDLNGAGVLTVAGVAKIQAAGAVALGAVGSLSITGVDDTQREYGELSLGSEGALSVVGKPRFTGAVDSHGAGVLTVSSDSITAAGYVALAAVGTLKVQNLATRRDITVTARLAERRWTSRFNESRRWAAHL